MADDWTSAAWRAEATAWLDDALAGRGARRTGVVEQVRVRPWATVLVAPSTVGRVWLKASGVETAFEAGLYEVLGEVAAEWVLEPLAVDAGRGWVLLPDGGPVIGGAERLGDALVEYARLQRRVAPHVDRLLDAGVVDMRPSALPARLVEAVAVVRGERPAAVGEGTAARVGELPAAGGDVAARLVGGELPAAVGDRTATRVVGGDLPAAFHDGTAARLVSEWAAELAESPVPASLDHNDLHGGNVLVSGRFYDWGDSVVAHPFAAAMVPLGVIRDELGAVAADAARDRYLAEFADYGSPGRLREELALACRLGIVARTLTWARAVGAGPSEFADAPRLTLMSLLDGP